MPNQQSLSLQDPKGFAASREIDLKVLAWRKPKNFLGENQPLILVPHSDQIDQTSIKRGALTSPVLYSTLLMLS